VFPVQLFRVLPNFYKCFYNKIETWRTSFRFLLENTATEKKENLLTLIIKLYILFARAIITSTARASSVFLSSYRNVTFSNNHVEIAIKINIIKNNRKD